MKDIFNEVFGNVDTKKLTPIEIALGIDNEGRTTATKLYEYLELNPSNYSKWFRKNITENDFAEENVDFYPFVLRYESLTGEKDRQDAKLTAGFAKKLSMMQKNKKGEAARDYFIGVENGAKKLIEKQSGQSITYQYPISPAALDSATNAGRLLERVMKSQGVPPHQIAEAIRDVFRQAGIELPDFVVKVPAYEQMTLDVFTSSI